MIDDQSPKDSLGKEDLPKQNVRENILKDA